MRYWNVYLRMWCALSLFASSNRHEVLECLPRRCSSSPPQIDLPHGSFSPPPPSSPEADGQSKGKGKVETIKPLSGHYDKGVIGYAKSLEADPIYNGSGGSSNERRRAVPLQAALMIDNIQHKRRECEPCCRASGKDQ